MYPLTQSRVAEVHESFKVSIFLNVCLSCSSHFFLPKPGVFFCKGNWPHPGRYCPLPAVFYHCQLNVIDSSGLWKFSSWWTLIILYSSRTFPDTNIFFGLLSDGFSITVTLSQIKLRVGEVVSLNILVVVYKSPSLLFDIFTKFYKFNCICTNSLKLFFILTLYEHNLEIRTLRTGSLYYLILYFVFPCQWLSQGHESNLKSFPWCDCSWVEAWAVQVLLSCQYNSVDLGTDSRFYCS